MDAPQDLVSVFGQRLLPQPCFHPDWSIFEIRSSCISADLRLRYSKMALLSSCLMLLSGVTGRMRRSSARYISTKDPWKVCFGVASPAARQHPFTKQLNSSNVLTPSILSGTELWRELRSLHFQPMGFFCFSRPPAALPTEPREGPGKNVKRGKLGLFLRPLGKEL